MGDSDERAQEPKAEEELNLPPLPPEPPAWASDDTKLKHSLASMDALMKRMEIRSALRNQEILDSKRDFISDNAWLCWKNGTQYKGEDLLFYLCEAPVYTESQKMKVTRPELWEKLYGVNSPLSSLMQFGRFCGYVRFPSLPLVAPGYGGIASYVPVHGGITYCQMWWDGSVTYGFGIAHACSSGMTEIISDVGWMMKETESMARNLQIAARFERFYLNARDDNEKKARVLTRMDKFLQIDPTSNLGVMLNILSGEL